MSTNGLDAQLKELADETAQTLSEKWAHPLLAKIWVILSMPDWDDGEAVLREHDLNEVGAAVIELNRIYNQPELKALRQHLDKDSEANNGIARLAD